MGVTSWEPWWQILTTIYIFYNPIIIHFMWLTERTLIPLIIFININTSINNPNDTQPCQPMSWLWWIFFFFRNIKLISLAISVSVLLRIVAILCFCTLHTFISAWLKMGHSTTQTYKECICFTHTVIRSP